MELLDNPISVVDTDRIEFNLKYVNTPSNPTNIYIDLRINDGNNQLFYPNEGDILQDDIYRNVFFSEILIKINNKIIR